MPVSIGMGRAYVQTSPLGLAGYSAGHATMNRAPSSQAEPLFDHAGQTHAGIEENGNNSEGLHPVHVERRFCETCGAALQADVRSCPNCKGMPLDPSS
jgi:hypothetical protein